MDHQALEEEYDRVVREIDNEAKYNVRNIEPHNEEAMWGVHHIYNCGNRIENFVKVVNELLHRAALCRVNGFEDIARQNFTLAYTKAKRCHFARDHKFHNYKGQESPVDKARHWFLLHDHAQLAQWLKKVAKGTVVYNYEWVNYERREEVWPEDGKSYVVTRVSHLGGE